MWAALQQVPLALLEVVLPTTQQPAHCGRHSKLPPAQPHLRGCPLCALLPQHAGLLLLPASAVVIRVVIKAAVVAAAIVAVVVTIVCSRARRQGGGHRLRRRQGGVGGAAGRGLRDCKPIAIAKRVLSMHSHGLPPWHP